MFTLPPGMDSAPATPQPASTPLLLAVAALALAVLIPFVGHCAIYIAYPFSLDETEGYVLGQVHRLSVGGRLYGPITESPYVVDNYPPAFPVLLNAIEGTLGRSYMQPPLLPDSDAPPDAEASIGVRSATLAHNFPLIRSVMALIVAGLLALLAYDWRRAGLSSLGIGLGLVLFVGQPAVFYMTPLARADWGALVLGMTALVLGQRAMQRPDDRPVLALAAIAGCLAMLFRQSAIVPLVSIAVMLWLARDRRLGFFLGIALVTGLVCAVALHLTYGGGMWTHLVTYTKTRWLFDRLMGTWGFFVRHSSLFLVLALLAWTSVRRSQGWTLPTIYAPLAVATALLSGKVGSDMNYFLEPILGCTWLIGYGCVVWSQAASPLPAWALIGIGAVLLQSGIVQNPRVGSYRPTRYDLANGVELLTQLQALEGPVLSEEEGMVALAGKPVWYNPFIMAELEREGLWDDAPVVELIRNQSLPVVITLEVPNPRQSIDRGRGAGWDRWTPSMLEALASNYRPAVVVPVRREWIVLVPRRPAAAADPLQSTPND